MNSIVTIATLSRALNWSWCEYLNNSRFISNIAYYDETRHFCLFICSYQSLTEKFNILWDILSFQFSIKRENEIRNEIFSDLPKGSQDHWTLSLSLQLILKWKNEECIRCRIQQREKSSQTGNIILNSVFRPLFSTRFEIKHPPQVRGCIAAESIQTSDVLNIFVIRVLLASLLTFWTFGTGHSRIEQIEMWKRDSATKAANNSNGFGQYVACQTANWGQCVTSRKLLLKWWMFFNQKPSIILVCLNEDTNYPKINYIW